MIFNNTSLKLYNYNYRLPPIPGEEKIPFKHKTRLFAKNF